jgi:hypothetical protein
MTDFRVMSAYILFSELELVPVDVIRVRRMAFPGHGGGYGGGHVDRYGLGFGGGHRGHYGGGGFSQSHSQASSSSSSFGGGFGKSGSSSQSSAGSSSGAFGRW